MDKIDWKAMKEVDVQTVDPETLVDLNSVVIPDGLSKEERIKEFVRQIKNPYCYKVGKMIVKVEFSEDGPTLEEQMQEYLKSL